MYVPPKKWKTDKILKFSSFPVFFIQDKLKNSSFFDGRIKIEDFPNICSAELIKKKKNVTREKRITQLKAELYVLVVRVPTTWSRSYRPDAGVGRVLMGDETSESGCFGSVACRSSCCLEPTPKIKFVLEIADQRHVIIFHNEHFFLR